MLWTREYMEFFNKDVDFFDIIFGSVDDTLSGEDFNETKVEKPVDSSKLQSFLESPFHKVYTHYLTI